MKNIKKSRKSNRENSTILYLCLLPFVFYATFKLFSFMYTFILSITNENGHFTLQNYFHIFNDIYFLKYLKNTLIIFLVGGTTQIIFSFLIASSLFLSKIKNKKLILQIYYLPNIISTVTITFLFSFLLDANFGFFSKFFNHLGFTFIDFARGGFSSQAMVSFICSWQWFGYDAIIIYASLSSIASSHIEYAKVEGCTNCQIITKIIFPRILPVIIFILFTSFISSLQMFDVPFILKNKFNSDSITTSGLYIYETAFNRYNYNYASAISMFIFFTVSFALVIGYLLFKFKQNKTRKYYD